MRIYTAPSGVEKTTLLREVPAGDYDARIHLLLEPQRSFQRAGLVVYRNNRKHLMLGRGYCDLAPPACVGNGIYFDHVAKGERVGGNYASATTETDYAYLRITRECDLYTGYHSADGVGWTLIGSHVPDFTPTRIGITTSGDLSNQRLPADFDYFWIRSDD